MAALSTTAGASRARRWAWALAAAALSLMGCGRREQVDPGADGGAPRPKIERTARTLPRKIDLLAKLPRCELRHRGLLFDLGTPAVDGLSLLRLTPDAGVTSVEREGATWARVSTRELSFRFVLDAPESVFVGARVRGLASKAATVLIDGKAVGTLSFSRHQTRKVETPLFAAPVSAGMHTVALRFSGSSRDGVDPFAEVDWVRVGFADDDPSSFAAPTLRDVEQDVALSGVPHRAVSLRGPGSLRCTLGVPPDGRLRTSLGLLGAGEGEAEVRVLVDGSAPVTLRAARLVGGDRATWTDVDLPLLGFEGQIVTLELAATSATRGARVVFGDPVIVGRDMSAVAIPRARAVVVVVLTGVDLYRLPPWSPDRPLPTLATLAREGVVFDRCRAPTTVTGGVLASIITGLSPGEHALNDGQARLPELLPTLGTVVKEASARTAMFTANPWTGEAFGFARGWDRYTMFSPISPALGTAPIDEIVKFIAEKDQSREKGLLAVAHARGIHPPYDLSPGEFAQLPPSDYAGPLDPRRAGQVLERFRQRKRAKEKWSAPDRARLSGMMDAALVATDRSLSNLIDSLRKAELWDDTLLIVTSDVAAALDPVAPPFPEALDLSEDVLSVPLVVRFPRGALAGTRAQAPATSADLARTALAALDVDLGAQGGKDLFSLAATGTTPVERALVARLGDRYASRWGDLRLAGRQGATPTLCHLPSDPRCERDALEDRPHQAVALFRETFDAEQRKDPPPRRESARWDADTTAALNVWGR
ncbi:MAG: sulfatase-like hydrolase/transferase [Polyangiaceae bacterium]|nr:sulfatase-like hydrolase/transferase [Polyangiaceae bacterium]